MKKIKYILIVIIFTLINLSGFSQENKAVGNPDNSQNERVVFYYYDNAGNRIKRKSIYIIPAQTRNKINIDTLEEQIAEKNILLYPNPVKQNLNIFIENYENEQGTVSVYALNGTLIKTKKINSDKININFSNQVYGTYIVKIKIADKIKEYTVIKKY